MAANFRHATGQNTAAQWSTSATLSSTNGNEYSEPPPGPEPGANRPSRAVASIANHRYVVNSSTKNGPRARVSNGTAAMPAIQSSTASPARPSRW